MSGNSTDERLFFRAGIGASIRLGLDGSSRQIPDVNGAIPPGKYVVQFLGLTAIAWVRSAPFVKGETITAAVPAGLAAGATDTPNEFPVDAAISTSFLLHVRSGINDRLAVILSAGTATMVMTQLGE